MGYLQPSTMAEPATVTRTALGGPEALVNSTLDDDDRA